MPSPYTPVGWYWVVAGDQSKWWSSAAASYVAPVQSWLDAGNLPTPIASEAELAAVLSVYGLTPPNAADLTAIDTAALNAALAAPGSIVRALGLVVFMIAKGTIPINSNYTLAQFVNLLKAQIR